MELQLGQELALEIIKRLEPMCVVDEHGKPYIEVAGSIRRCKESVRDIDIVLIPRDWWGLTTVFREWGAPIVHGPKIERLIYKGHQLDFYFATKENWATLLLIKTGSKENNIRLCKWAKDHSMILHADGRGLFALEAQGCEGHEVRIAGDTELSIYQALGLPYQRPEERK